MKKIKISKIENKMNDIAIELSFINSLSRVLESLYEYNINSIDFQNLISVLNQKAFTTRCKFNKLMSKLRI